MTPSHHSSLLEAVFQHLVLPPQLPAVPDDDAAQLNWELVARLIRACREVRDATADTLWTTIEASLLLTQELCRPVSAETLAAAFSAVVQENNGNKQDNDQWLALHVVQQNAALLIHKTKETEEIVLEAFETSASAPDTLQARGALRSTFPCRAVAVPRAEFAAEHFRAVLAEFMEQATETAFDQFAMRARKAGTMVIETRDAPSPALVTEMLLSFLEAIGRAFPVHVVGKRVRDDVVLGSSEHPWRRSPYWLMLRVLVQRIIADRLGGDAHASRLCFKLFMCVVLSHFLSDCQASIHAEQVLMLQAKLCRRLAKLQREVSEATAPLQKRYGKQLAEKQPFFETVVAEAGRVVAALWDDHRKRSMRLVPLLPQTAAQSDLYLRLANSGPKLRALLVASVAPPRRRAAVGHPSSQANSIVMQVNEFAARHAGLVVCTEEAMSTLNVSQRGPDDACIALSQAMTTYMEAVRDCHVGDSLLMSQYLLNLFELWTAMDTVAVELCPTLKNYHPVFVPESLDLLCLLAWTDLERLRQVQKHLSDRIRDCNSSKRTIFSEPNHKASFASSYMKENAQRSGLQALMAQIEAASSASAEAKTRELGQLMAQRESLSAEIKSSICVCKRQSDGSLDVRGCKRCYKERCRRRLRVRVHEEFLPRKMPQKAPILLELRMPAFLAAYRDATWRLRMLGRASGRRRSDAVLFLADFGPLKAFRDPGVRKPLPLTLASRSKAYLQTHYCELKLPKTAKEVLLPFGPAFTYYDTENGVWADDCVDIPWYHGLLGSWLPDGVVDRFANVALYMDGNNEHPSSYEIAANQDERLPNMSYHEFTAYQAAMAGTYRRWIVIAMELGSTNLNLSSGTAGSFFKRLALQSGPRNPDADLEPLGKVHSMLRETSFCSSLAHQIHQRLAALDSGRRDLDGMSVLVTLTLRLVHLGPENAIQSQVASLLSSIRKILSLWISQLHEELRGTVDGDAARKAASDAFWAALLSRQTFTAGVSATDGFFFGTDDALHFFRASIALSESLLEGLGAVLPSLRRLLAQDMTSTALISKQISAWTIDKSSALEAIINETWIGSDSSEPRSFLGWTLCDDGGEWLASATAPTALFASQTIHYHVLHGHLLIDGQGLGKLPLAIRQDAGILELFRDQHLLARSSGLAGMEYQIFNGSVVTGGHEVHVGVSNNGNVVIRALFAGSLLEFVPRDVFGSDTTLLDLPFGLVQGCVHWLDLQTGELEMRRKPNIWSPKASNWVLNVRDQTATRGRTAFAGRDRTRLVEPRSEIGSIITGIFRHFEDPGHLTIFQPMSDVGRLSVEIKRLEMRFFVNRKGLLQSVQLKSEIDPVQEIGALHGLESKIVLRSISDARRKSIIVPMGPGSWQRSGPHVAVRIANDGHYALFGVDSILGRLTCAPEPALFYLKALIHALTSFPLPDKLTGRTGTDEAVLCLLAAYSQPWKPLNILPQGILSTIMRLSPRREYYPPALRLYQRVAWDDNLTATIQHEQLAILAADILRSSDAIDMRDEKKVDNNAADVLYLPTLHRLSLRGILRRQVYESIKHPSDLEMLSEAREDDKYQPRGVKFRSQESMRVHTIVRQLRQKRGSLTPARDSLKHMLKSWHVIDGFNNTFAALDIARNLTIDESQAFGPLVRQLTSSEAAKDCAVQLSLAVFVFGARRKVPVVEWLAAIGTSHRLQAVELPEAKRFTDFAPEAVPDAAALRKLVVSCQDSYATYRSQSGQRPKRRHQAGRAALTAQRYNTCIEREAEELVSWLVTTWPYIPLKRLPFVEGCGKLQLEFVSAKTTWAALAPELHRLWQNYTLSEYVRQLEAMTQPTQRNDEEAIDSRGALGVSQPSFVANVFSVYQIPSLGSLLRSCHKETGIMPWENNIQNGPALLALDHHPSHVNILRRVSTISKELSTLLEIVQPFKQSRSIIQQQYGQDLEDSIAALALSLEQPQMPCRAPSQEDLEIKIDKAERNLQFKHSVIRSLLFRHTPGGFWLQRGRLWPCDSVTSLLEQLRLDTYQSLPLSLQQSLISFGISVTELQHLQRMNEAKLDHDDKKLQDEATNTGHSNWSPADYPEWLLLEIDNNILIRPLQVDVAKAIISPHSGLNSVLQMNMGTGKTSVVIPMAALILANTRRLCRVVVPKALLLQTAQVLQSRVGGLLGRQVRHIPFSRRSSSDAATLSRYKDVHDEMLQSGGLMLCIPAHLLSFKLSGLQRLADYRLAEGQQMVEMQNWLDSICRDILDESDMTLSVNTQLIYPSGELAALDGHPYRWLVVEQLLDFVQEHASDLQKAFEGKLVVVERRQGYPILHFITKDPEDALNMLLVEDVCSGRLPQLQIRESESDEARKLVKQIICGVHVSASEWDRAIKSLKDDVFGPKTLYLLRGLVSQRILLVCLKKKWNIQYGLHTERQPIAVPFEAKGSPSQTAEYGHPDTTLILTCLAFYHKGLSKEQLRQGLQDIIQSDDATSRYDRWVCSCPALPPSLRYWNLVDPENDLQIESLWKYLRLDRTVINHYLNTYVFPQHAKQFPVKLLASGWDIPLWQPTDGGQPQSLTTGFSGTNDNKRILPRTIRQRDLHKLLHTNAQVLCHLLENRNWDCHLAAASGVRFQEHTTLRFLSEKRIRVLIDAGAHILEMENHDVAGAWLSIDTGAEGAVYFGANSQIMVRSRFQKDPMPLLASPFANDLGRCVVYIDEGHTRGTDLKLPAQARGAVTLGLGQTKDQTVQAAMRLRQLGTTQSVAFLAPPEVYCGILDLRLAHTGEVVRPFTLTSRDVLRWLLEQSCKANEQMMSLHLSQCRDFCRRSNVLSMHPDYATNSKSLAKVMSVIRQEERQTLQQMYGPGVQPEGTERIELASLELQTFVEDVSRLAQHGPSSCSSALMEVEQEREVVLEVEHMREKETKARHVTCTFPGLDTTIAEFIDTGHLDTRATSTKGALLHAFEYVGRTTIGTQYAVHATASRFYVSREFSRGIDTNSRVDRNDIIRAVNWIMWSPCEETALVIIPEEADVVIPLLREQRRPLVWLLGYAAPVTKSMHPFQCLAYLTVPRWPSVAMMPVWLSIEVGIFSGSLYFDFSEYKPLLAWLGVGRSDGKTPSSFSDHRMEEPLRFLQEWLTFRRQTEDIFYTPAGFVCQSKRLYDGHFFFL